MLKGKTKAALSNWKQPKVFIHAERNARIWAMRKTGATLSVIAKEFSISASSIRLIVSFMEHNELLGLDGHGCS